jgi:hypothetical protein
MVQLEKIGKEAQIMWEDYNVYLPAAVQFKSFDEY